MARSADDVLTSLYNKAIAEGLVTTRFEQGRLGLIFSVIAKELYTFETLLEDYIRQMNLTTATDALAIELLAKPYHIKQPSKRANVILRFTKQETVVDDYVIPAGLYIETADWDPIQYQTLETKTFYKEEEYVDIRAIAIEPGSLSMVDANQLSIIKNQVHSRSLIVTNLEKSYGGEDEEPIEVLRQSALSFRYDLEKGTYVAITEALRDYGLNYYEFNLIENAFGYGSIGLYVDTTLDTVIDEKELLVKKIKASGIYLRVEKATPIETSFDFTINVSTPPYGLFPEERDELKSLLEQKFEDYVNTLGVGQPLIISRAVNYIYTEFQRTHARWLLSDIHITAEGEIGTIDGYGNVIPEDYDIIKVSDIDITVTVG